MIERQGGRIINIASLAGLIGHPFNASYSASKHALVGFTKSIRVELAPFGIEMSFPLNPDTTKLRSSVSMPTNRQTSMTAEAQCSSGTAAF
jgi:short-subunit dehydrogenase